MLTKRLPVPALLISVVCIVRVSAGETPVLENNDIAITLDGARQYLPVSIRTGDGLEVIKPGGVGFQLYMRILRENSGTPKVYESKTGWLRFYGSARHSQAGLKSVTTITGGTCNVTRTISLPRQGSRVDVLYEVEAAKPFTIAYGTWMGGLFLSFPEFALNPDFDRSFRITFENEKLKAALHNKAPEMVAKPPYWSPVFAASSKHDSMVMITPTLMENCDIIPGGMPVTVPNGHAFRVGFAIEVRKLMTNEELSAWLNRNDDGILKTGLGQNLYFSGSKIYREKGKKEVGRVILSEAADRCPKDVYLHNMLGYAGDSYRGWYTAAKLEPENPRFVEWGANVIMSAVEKKQRSREKLDEALQMTAHALKVSPKAAMLRVAHARLLDKLGRHKEAVEHMRRALVDIKGTKDDKKERVDHYKNLLRDFESRGK